MQEKDISLLKQSEVDSERSLEQAQQLKKFSVFISYRVNPDHGLAIALKELIESAIEPKPEVFVSGAGGLRPSNIGYKPQIQSAVQSAQAFIAIITQQSKDREWIFYEAGAAWGRNQLYAPLLIDTSPGELASTIADYQATWASKKDDMERLIYTIAESVGGNVKTHFANRYRAFSKRVEGYQETDISTNDSESPLQQAVECLRHGEIEEANKLFCQLENDANNNEEKANIRITKLLNNPELKNSNLLRAIETFPSDYKNTSYSMFWLGILETHPAAAINYYQKCIDLWRQDKCFKYVNDGAVLNLAEERYRIGEHNLALETLREAMRSKDRDLRAGATKTWNKLNSNSHHMEQLVILSSGLIDEPDSEELLNALTELALKNDWKSILIYFVQRLDRSNKKGSSANSLGRAFQQLDLPSLSYLAYTKAVEAGISVAKVNIANLHSSNYLHAAGLKILRDHTGLYDAADAGYPYDMRAKLERKVQEEEAKAKALYEKGSDLFAVLSNFAWECVRSRKENLDKKQIKFSTGVVTISEMESESLKLIGDNDETQLELGLVGKTIGLWISTNDKSSTSMYCFTQQDMLELNMNLSNIDHKVSFNKYPIFDKNNLEHC